MSRKGKLWLIIGLTLLVSAVLFSWPHIPQTQAYHLFCDQRESWGIPNFENVLSNLPFAIVGIGGLITAYRTPTARGIKIIYASLFTGIALTAAGSGYYHYQPGDETLVFDRLPMTIVFMGLLAAVLYETIGPRTGMAALGPLLITGIGSVLWWRYTEKAGDGDLRLYILVQYYPMLLIPLLLLLFPLSHSKDSWRPLGLTFAWYGLAKLFEAYDCPIFNTIHIGGHALKHLAAAIATAYLVRRFQLLYQA